MWHMKFYDDNALSSCEIPYALMSRFIASYGCCRGVLDLSATFAYAKP
jgi:hypothetical protein